MSATLEHAIATSTPSERSGRAFRVVRIVLGLLLLTAAGLKLYGMNVTAFPRAGWFATPRVQIMAAEWELVLGLWLLSGVFQFGAWLAAIGTFATFAGVSAYFGWIGVANCGCFGVIHTSPWVAFAVDVVALVGLAFGRPTQTHSSPPCFAICVRRATMGLSVLVGMGLISIGVFGSIPSALAWLQNSTLTSTPDFVDLGEGMAGEILEGHVVIHNWAKTPVTIIGGISDCSCVITDDLPLTIAPGTSRPLKIRMKVATANPGIVTREALFWTDNCSQSRIRIKLGCLTKE